MLMTLGPVAFEVYPFNATEYEHDHSSDFVQKPVIGARQPLEWVGEGAETWTIKAKVYPFRFGGLEDIEKLRQVRISGRPQFLQRGDGQAMGWVVIEGVRERSTYLGRAGVGKSIGIDIDVTRSQAPSGGSYYSLMAGLFN